MQEQGASNNSSSPPKNTLLQDSSPLGDESSAAITTDTNAAAAFHAWGNFQQRKDQMMQTITTQWHNNKSTRDQILKSTQQHGEQVKQSLQTLGTKLQQQGGMISQDLITAQPKLKEQFQNIGSKLSNLKIIGGASSNEAEKDLAMFNERMKEEALRRDVRREAEEASLQIMREHLKDFLSTTSTSSTYEEWIYALHPENTQDASLLHDMEYKEVDLRFYVDESDHRRLWNEMVTDPHRQVAARTRMFGDNKSQSSSSSQQDPLLVMDLLGMDTTSTTSCAAPGGLPVGESSALLDATDPFDAPNVAAVAAAPPQDNDLLSFF